MSQHFVALIPVDPAAPLPDTADAVRAALETEVQGSGSRVKDYGKLQFIDCGENFERSLCPACGTEVPMKTWQAWMGEDWHGEEGFHLHAHTLPCCGEETTLNALDYRYPQGFSRWMISAGGDYCGAISDAGLARLSALAGVPLRVISQTY